MSMIQPILEEFRYEVATTRKLLERLPENQLGWKPHEKSMTMGALASHIVEIPRWTEDIFDREEVDLDPATYQPWIGRDKKEILEKFDSNTRTAVQAMEGQPDDTLSRTWTMKMKGRVAFSMPRTGVVRGFILSHMIHHRAQLGVYLRLRDVPLPSVYGPTADEEPPMRDG